MKRHIFILMVLLLVLSSCNDWLLEPSPGISKLEDYFTSGASAEQCVTACYVPLMWEYNSTYFPEWFIGDVVSDDALKGGQNIGDMSDVYDMENWKTNTNNGFLLDFYRAQFQGVGRCNLALSIVPEIAIDSVLSQTKNGINLQSRLLGEAYFLRAYYYFRLLRVFGGVPKVDFVISSSDKWRQPRATSSDIYDFILQDLEKAQALLWKKSQYDLDDLGRVTKGAAQAMLLKVNLYMKNYADAKAWGDSIINSHEYDLCQNYNDNFTLAGENGVESVFEIQYAAEQTSDYGEGEGFTRGSFTQVLTRSRSPKLGGGWGFDHPTQNLYDEFESGDLRRDVSILTPSDDQMTTRTEEIYLGSRYLNRKLMWINADSTFTSLDHDSRGPLNNRQIRYSDVLLMYAEACLGTDDEPNAIFYLNKVRKRVNMLEYPNYKFKINGVEITPTLEQAIRHERRVELAMEGHRWFDLCRWGIVKETMDAYKATETPEVQAEMATFVKGTHELFPIPSKEIDLNPMEQNPGYY
ncbi:MAG: RagB/SusD family nutrient uptake outer membrane protein [Paludibacter sp.]|nr:RagB/SusD family nutrient uptake outer membrane protein [Paludibacter sp.]